MMTTPTVATRINFRRSFLIMSMNDAPNLSRLLSFVSRNQGKGPPLFPGNLDVGLNGF